MESDCRLTQNSLQIRKDRVMGTFQLSVIFLIISNVIPVVPFYIDCDRIQQAGHCECSKLEVYSIDCPRGYNVHPIQLLVDVYNASDQAYLTVKCNFENEPKFHWEEIQGVDLSEDIISAKIIKLSLERCPAVPNALKNLLNRLNVSSEHIKRFTMKLTENSSIPDSYVSEFKNLEVLNLSFNQLEKLPDLSFFPNLNELNLRNNRIQSLPTNSFSKNKNLKRVVLSQNFIERINSKIFPDSLEHLEISGSKLSTITNESFANLNNLQTLLLERAALNNAHPDCLNNLVNLKELWINQCNFTTFPNFFNLPKLENLFANGIRVENQPIKLKNLPALSKFNSISSKLTFWPEISNVPNLSILDLSRNQIKTLPKVLFPFPALTVLDLSGNLVEEIVEIKAPKLEKLGLRSNKIKHLPKIAFVHLLQLKEIDISRNMIQSVDYQAFENQGELVRIDISRNGLSYKSPFSNMSTDVLGEMSGSFLSKCIQLKQIDLSYNLFDAIFDDWRNVFLSLELLDLSNNNISGLNAFDFHFITTKKFHLNLTNNKISHLNLQSAWIFQDNKDASIDVYIDGNPIVCDCLAYSVKNLRDINVTTLKFHYGGVICNDPPNLRGSLLTKVEEKELLCKMEPVNCFTDSCPCYQRPVDKTILVNCSNRDLSDQNLPLFNWQLSQLKAWMVDVDFSKNSITKMNSSYISGFPKKVKFVDLSQNHLTSIGFLNTLKDENSTAIFSFSQNSFMCNNDDCLDFTVIWATQSSRIVDSENITCQRNESVNKTLTIQNLSQLIDSCSNQSDHSAAIHILVICVAVFATLCIVMIIIMVRYSWVIKALLFSKGWGWCLFWENNTEDDESQDKIYDAFVSYSHKDEDWVVDELVKRLEGEEGFKLCLHFRDWIPGDWIPDQIVRSVDHSKRTVVILSKNFVDSIWSRLEFKAAHAQALSRGSNRVILVLIEDDLQEKDLQDEDLQIYMKMNTYLKWSDPWFWHKLKYALPHRKNKDEGDNVIKKIRQKEKARELDKIRTKLEQAV